mgnify:CR=1 FL=1
MDSRAEAVLRVQPLSRAEIRTRAERMLRAVAPEQLEHLAPLPARQLILERLEPHGIRVGFEDLPEAVEARTRAPGPEHPANLWALVELRPWDLVALCRQKAPPSRALATLAHELGHVVLHVRQLAVRPPRVAPLEQVAPYEEAEWQAWCFAGCLCAPVGVARMELGRGATVAELAASWGISRVFLARHLARYGLAEDTEQDNRQLALEGA